ncbi:aldo/keto reductase, partial [Candidatus Pseudothioglobus singularis]|nr:aldo/keto reductase [Candidatus Pseudothioglobus singularis]
EIHVRSIFLQGLLLIEPKKRNSYFNQWNEFFKIFDKWVFEKNQTRISSCINFVMMFKEIDRVVVGVESKEQFEEIITIFNKNQKTSAPDYIECKDPMLINPANWYL